MSLLDRLRRTPAETAEAPAAREPEPEANPVVDDLRALASARGADEGTAGDEDEDRFDSVVGKRSLVLARRKECPDCWAMLREDFIPGSPNRYQHKDHDEHDDAHNHAPVGTHAWLVLQWLVTIFEEDERIRQGNNGLDVQTHLGSLQWRSGGSTSNEHSNNATSCKRCCSLQHKIHVDA